MAETKRTLCPYCCSITNFTLQKEDYTCNDCGYEIPKDKFIECDICR
jgi:tRNA(Ile2) C34 agmatinyltransferase TiaS